MSEWLDFALHLGGSRLLLLLLPVVCIFSFFVYRRTYPSADRRRRFLLAGLRSAAGILLLLLLIEPVVDLWRRQVVRPVLLVLLDTSSSMATEEDGGSRLEQVKKIVQSEEWQRGVEAAEIRIWGFAEVPYPLAPDTLAAVHPGGRGTDLAAAVEKTLEQVSERDKVQGMLLFSDGRHNLGRDPVKAASKTGFPVYALAVGSRKSPADVQIVRAASVGMGYVGHPLRVEAEVRSWGYEGKAADLLLYEGERIVARQRLMLQGNGLIQTVSFSVEPETAGPHIYRLAIPSLAGEFSRDNNEALIFARVLEEKIQVLLVSGGPSPDLSFLLRSLKADSSMVVEPLIQKEEDRFYQEERRNRIGKKQDVVILLNVGRDLLNGELGDRIQSRLREGAGLLFIAGPRTFQGWDPAAPLAEALPVVMKPRGSRFVAREIFLKLAPEGRRHPVVRVQVEVGKEGDDPWVKLPPLPGYFPLAGKKPGAVVLVEGSKGHEPIAVSGRYGQGRIIVLLSGGFWRLDLLSSGVDGRPQVIRDFWRNAVQWLALHTSGGRVRVSTEKQIYRAGEPVVFAAQVFDELLRPQKNALVTISLEGREGTFPLADRGEGSYRGEGPGLEPGEYQYVARAYAGDLPVGEDKGEFIVEQYSVESMDVSADPDLLGEMARASGGRMMPLEKWRELIDLLSLRKHITEEKETFAFQGKSWPFVLLIALLTVEWSVRKRGGMI